MLVAFSHPLPKLLQRLAVAAGLLALASLLWQMLGSEGMSSPSSMAMVMLPFLFAFACFKGALARETQLNLQRGGPVAADLIAQHGSRAGVKQWIVYKYAATSMALIACLLLGLIAL
ncbi:MAG: hypothetical protein EA402_06990 [Planctomycetota bacterium]|nr:MAG: hypothetical protein EA402_06990 [Planctomycetota bacterium]